MSSILIEKISVESRWLKRKVNIELYIPSAFTNPADAELLLINDGQNMQEMGFESVLQQFSPHNLICAAIHAGPDRKSEYGIAGHPDYRSRGAKAYAYTLFIIEELLPLLYQRFGVSKFFKQSFAGFSLGGLMALDIVWSYPEIFQTAGVFSGSLWWRSKDQDAEDYNDDQDRIMQQQIRKGNYKPGLRFFFQCGNMDETKDRNQNGIIDSIDDTLDLIKELETKGYQKEKDIFYLEMPDGRHDIATWGKAMPFFLNWL
jgi:enterochelin esterase-like enzyme